LGELLVQAKVITPEQLAEVLQAPREPGKKIGQLLIARGWLNEAQLTQTLSLQLSVPWVSLYHIDFSRQLLNLVSRDLADRHCMIPIFVRHVKGQGDTLYVAMDDPTNNVAIEEVSKQAGLPTKPMIASATDIRSAIRVYYGEAPVPQNTEIATDARPSHVEAELESTELESTELEPELTPAPPSRSAPPLPRTKTRSESSESLSAARPSTPSETDTSVRRHGAKVLALTLLDGTTINLPSRPTPNDEPESSDHITARDYVSALRAVAHGADAVEILGDKPQWEPVVAALLSILLRKGLIADWEFVDELRKI